MTKKPKKVYEDITSARNEEMSRSYPKQNTEVRFLQMLTQYEGYTLSDYEYNDA